MNRKYKIINSRRYGLQIRTSGVIIFLFCLFQINFLYSQIESEGSEKTHYSFVQTDTTYYVNGVKVRVFKSEQQPLFIFIGDTSSDFSVHPYSVVFCHYDSLNLLRIDSVISEKSGNREYYHYVDGKIKLKYTYYHKKDINVSETETRNDSVAIINVVRFKDNDTVVQSDTIVLYYPDSGSINYISVNITLEALGEKVYSSDTSYNNKMRIFIMKYENDSTDVVVLYTISNIFKKSLQVTRKTGVYLYHSLFEPKEDMIKKYTYESTLKKIVNKKMKKVLKKITSLESLPIDDFWESFLVECVINGKYYYLTYEFDINNFFIMGDPESSEEEREKEEILELVKKLVIYLDNSFK